MTGSEIARGRGHTAAVVTFAVIAVIAVTAAGCAVAAPSTGRHPEATTTPRASGVDAPYPVWTAIGPTGAPVDAHPACGRDRVVALVEAYVAAYNARDVTAVRALFDVDHPYFEYVDTGPGRSTQLRGAQDAPRWEEHLRGRFAAADRLAITALTHYEGYAEVRLARTTGQGRPAAGSAKIVCDGGRLIRVIMAA